VRSCWREVLKCGTLLVEQCAEGRSEGLGMWQIMQMNMEEQEHP